MAKAKAGPALTSISGKIGATVFAPGARGIVIQPSPIRVRIRGSRGSPIARNWARAARRWLANTTQAQRDAWSAFAALNPVKDVFNQNVTLSGYSMFIKLNVPLISANQTPISDPPANLTITQQGQPTGTSTVAGPLLRLDSFAPAIAATEFLQILSGAALPPGRSKPARRYTLLKTIVQPAATPIDFHAEYIALFPAPQATQKVPLQIRVLNAANGAFSKATTVLLTTT